MLNSTPFLTNNVGIYMCGFIIFNCSFRLDKKNYKNEIHLIIFGGKKDIMSSWQIYFFIGFFLWPILSASSCIWEHYFCWLDNFKWQSEINNINTGFPCSIDLLGPKSLSTHLYQSFNYRELWQKVTQMDECLQEGVSLLSVTD